MKKEHMDLILNQQRNEITEHEIYKYLAKKTTGNNKKVLKHMAVDELNHYNIWKDITKKDLHPKSLIVFIYTILSSIFGLAFSLKLMERHLNASKSTYLKFKNYKGIQKIIRDEEIHEKNVLNLIREERVEYASSIILGLNDALVELSGALAGLTFALQNSKLVAITGLITGVAASLSMAASGYLSSKEEKGSKKPLKSALYTGIAYVIAVLFLTIPYFLFTNVYHALATMLITVLILIAGYMFYISTAKNLSFWKRFAEMAAISLTVAIISFIVGYILKSTIGIDV